MSEPNKFKPEEVTVIIKRENPQNAYVLFKINAKGILALEITNKRNQHCVTVNVSNILALLQESGLLHLYWDNLGPALLDDFQRFKRTSDE